MALLDTFWRFERCLTLNPLLKSALQKKKASFFNISNNQLPLTTSYWLDLLCIFFFFLTLPITFFFDTFIQILLTFSIKAKVI